MNSDLQTSIAAIKAECENVLRLSEKATAGPWEADGFAGCDSVRSADKTEVCYTSGRFIDEPACPDASFIAHARNVSPAMARVVLMMIDECQLREDWESIANQWEGKP